MYTANLLCCFLNEKTERLHRLIGSSQILRDNAAKAQVIRSYKNYDVVGSYQTSFEKLHGRPVHMR